VDTKKYGVAKEIAFKDAPEAIRNKWASGMLSNRDIDIRYNGGSSVSFEEHYRSGYMKLVHLASKSLGPIRFVACTALSVSFVLYVYVVLEGVKNVAYFIAEHG
jgi:hypothetical protein